MYSDKIQAQFLSDFKEDPELRDSIENSVNKIRPFFRKPITDWDNFRASAHLFFMEINQLIVTKAAGAEVWEDIKNVFNHAMGRGPTSGRRTDSREDNAVNQLLELAKFGYSLVVTDQMQAEDDFNEIWNGVKDRYRQSY